MISEPEIQIFIKNIQNIRKKHEYTNWIDGVRLIVHSINTFDTPMHDVFDFLESHDATTIFKRPKPNELSSHPDKGLNGWHRQQNWMKYEFIIMNFSQLIEMYFVLMCHNWMHWCHVQFEFFTHSCSLRVINGAANKIVNMCFSCVRLIAVRTIRIYLNNYVAPAATALILWPFSLKFEFSHKNILRVPFFLHLRQWVRIYIRWESF